MNKKKFIFLTTLILLSGCSSKKATVSFINGSTIELGSEINSCSLVKTIDNQEINESMISGNSISVNGKKMTCSDIDTSVLGTQNVYFNFEKRLFEVSIEIKDTTSPLIEMDNVEAELNEQVDLLEMAEISDNGNISKKILSGDYDFSKSGTYDLTIIAEDESGNVGKKDFTLTVKEEEKVVKSTPKNNTTSKPTNSQTNSKTVSTNVETPKQEEQNNSSNYETSNEPSNDSTVSSSCQGGSMHAEAEKAEDLNGTAGDFMFANGCKSVYVESDGTQYGWNIVCSCN